MRVAPLLLVASASAVERWFDVCPESDAVIHAWARTTVRFDAPCKTVKGEMLARIAGKNGWTDPHNSGTYELTSAVGDVVAASHVTGNGRYTDKLQFMFENADGGDDCEVSGCSVSQGARGVHKNCAKALVTPLRPLYRFGGTSTLLTGLRPHRSRRSSTGVRTTATSTIYIAAGTSAARSRRPILRRSPSTRRRRWARGRTSSSAAAGSSGSCNFVLNLV